MENQKEQEREILTAMERIKDLQAQVKKKDAIIQKSLEKMKEMKGQYAMATQAQQQEKDALTSKVQELVNQLAKNGASLAVIAESAGADDGRGAPAAAAAAAAAMLPQLRCLHRQLQATAEALSAPVPVLPMVAGSGDGGSGAASGDGSSVQTPWRSKLPKDWRSTLPHTHPSQPSLWRVGLQGKAPPVSVEFKRTDDDILGCSFVVDGQEDQEVVSPGWSSSLASDSSSDQELAPLAVFPTAPHVETNVRVTTDHLVLSVSRDTMRQKYIADLHALPDTEARVRSLEEKGVPVREIDEVTAARALDYLLQVRADVAMAVLVGLLDNETQAAIETAICRYEQSGKRENQIIAALAELLLQYDAEVIPKELCTAVPRSEISAVTLSEAAVVNIPGKRMHHLTIEYTHASEELHLLLKFPKAFLTGAATLPEVESLKEELMRTIPEAEYTPQRPQWIEPEQIVRDVSQRQFELAWEIDEESAGNVVRYEIQYTLWVSLSDYNIDWKPVRNGRSVLTAEKRNVKVSLKTTYGAADKVATGQDDQTCSDPTVEIDFYPEERPLHEQEGSDSAAKSSRFYTFRICALSESESAQDLQPGRWSKKSVYMQIQETSDSKYRVETKEYGPAPHLALLCAYIHEAVRRKHNLTRDLHLTFAVHPGDRSW